MTRFFYTVLISVFVISSNCDLQDYPYMLSQALEKSNGISEKCMKQLTNISSNQTRFWQMFDASAKFPFAGVLYSSIVQYGNFDECLDIDYEDSDAGRVLGKYCYSGFNIPYALLNSLGIPVVDFRYNISTDFIGLSLCVPDGCEKTDFLEIISLIPLEIEPVLYNFTDIYINFDVCTTKETGTEFKIEDIVVTTVITLIILLMIASTAFDIISYILDKSEDNTPHPIYTAFSVYSNGKELFKIAKTRSKEHLHVFDGLKFISLMWVIAGHGFQNWDDMTTINSQVHQSWQTQRYAQYIATAPLAVDTFFFISAFLLAYGYLKSESPQKLSTQIKSVPYMYLRRYIRLTPAVLMIYLVTISIYQHIGSGPLYHSVTSDWTRVCKDQWWSYFLYIQNYHNYDEICLIQMWYLAADMQMFLFTPIILIPLSFYIRKNFKLAMGGLALLNLVCIAIPLIVKFIWKDYGAANTYDTHSRFCNYSIGLTLGAFMRVKMDQRFPFKKWQNFLIWVLMLCEMFAVVLVYQEVLIHKTYERQAVFESFMRPLWCIGLCWIVYSSYHGHGGIINWFLGSPMFQIGAKLSFCMFVVHESVVRYIVMTNRTELYFSDYNEFYFWCGHFILSIVIGTFWVFAFESPMIIIIEKIIFSGGGSKKQTT